MARRGRINPGWLTLQRERYGESYQYVPPENLRQVGDLLPGVLKDIGLESESRLSEISACWVEVAGKSNAEHSRPGEWENGVLTVYVDHPLWLAELQRFAAPALRKRLVATFGAKAVRELRFALDPQV